MENLWKPRGALKSQLPTAGGAVIRQVPMLGVVKDNVDPTRSGRIRVYISALGGKDPDDEKNWTPVLYMSPFFGQTEGSGGKSNYGSYKTNPISYGMWYSPPDVGTIVVCLFVNGDPNFGFYIGSVPEAEAMRMVPAIGANFPNEDVIFDKAEANSYGGATKLPVTNMNTNNSRQADSSTFLITPKPVHSFQASVMFQQGILRDPLRGPISTSSQRESPSRVGWGVSSPGRPIYEGGFTDETVLDAAGNANQQTGLKVISRRAGHSIVMDDGDIIGQDNLIRIRTSLGHQILMSDDGQTLMLLHSNGQSYIELGKEGTVDIYGSNSINLRTNGDLNLHADNNININATKKLNIQADEINVNSETSINQKSGTDYKIFTQGVHTHKVVGAMSLVSDAEAMFKSVATTYIKGDKVMLNSGESSTTPEEVPPIPLNAQTDTLFDSEKGWMAAPGKLLTIVSRAPAHMPWANAGQGVDVKVNLNSSSALPSDPSPEVASVNSVASSNSNVPTATVPSIATVPAVGAVSQSLDKNVTSGILSSMATGAVAGTSASAVLAGAGTITNELGQTNGISVGTLGLNATQLQNSNLLKPGSGNLVNSLVQSGTNLTNALPSNLFTGQNGVNNLTSLVNNPTAQVNAAVSNLQQSQNALTQAGILKGTEGAASIAGLVMAGSTAGVGQTISTVKNLTGSLTAPAAGLAAGVQSAQGGVLGSVASGNLGANLSQNVTSGLSGISKALEPLQKGISGILDKAKGAAAGAFAAIKASFKSFKEGVPQNLKSIADNQIVDEEKPKVDPLEGLSPEQIAKLNGADPTDPIIRSRLGLPALGKSLTENATNAAGINALPGGIGTVANVVNKGTDAVNAIPGVSAVKGLINNASTANTNGINLQGALSNLSNLTPNLPNVGGAVKALSAKLTAGLGGLTALASTGLPTGAASQLNSSIASISSGGSLPIKIPTVATNTSDRGELNTAVNNLVPQGVPAPNFSGVTGKTVSLAENQVLDNAQRQKLIEELTAKLKAQQKIANVAEQEYLKIEKEYPAGDPTVQAAFKKWDDEIAKGSQIADELATALGIT